MLHTQQAGLLVLCLLFGSGAAAAQSVPTRITNPKTEIMPTRSASASPPEQLKPSRAAIGGSGSILVFPYYAYSEDGSDPGTNTEITITSLEESNIVITVRVFYVSNEGVKDVFIRQPRGTRNLEHPGFKIGATGFIVAVVVSPDTGAPVAFNHLIGSGYVKLSNGAAGGYLAEAYEALFQGTLPTYDAAQASVTLPLDGLSYSLAPSKLALNDPPALNVNNSPFLVINRLQGSLTNENATWAMLYARLFIDARTIESMPAPFNQAQFAGAFGDNYVRFAGLRLSSVLRWDIKQLLVFNATNGAGISGCILNFNPDAKTAPFYNGGHNLQMVEYAPASLTMWNKRPEF